ncbi:3805_t:CDS:2 [Entrophospora sp. SA101]|nr:3805_t:CDS:2 [Entrophospora sp. SA101]
MNSSGNSKVDLFIEETLKKSVYCNDFIEWIPIERISNLNFLASGGNSEVYVGSWWLPDTPSTTVVIKVLKDSKIINDRILNEFKIHYKCYRANKNLIIPFYGITYHGSDKNFAMILKKAEYGDLRNYLYKYHCLDDFEISDGDYDDKLEGYCPVYEDERYITQKYDFTVNDLLST